MSCRKCPFYHNLERRAEPGAMAGHLAQTEWGRLSMVFPFLTVLEFGDKLYVSVMRPLAKGEGPNELIIYEKDKRVGSLPISGLPRAVDDKGRLYCSAETPFPQLIRYVVSEK